MAFDRRFRLLALCGLMSLLAISGPATGAQEGPVLSFQSLFLDGQGGLDGLGLAFAVAASPDSRFVYVLALRDASISVFEVDPPTGNLVQRHLYRFGLGGADYLRGVWDLAMAPDGRHLYVSASRLVVLRRDPDSGALTFVESHEQQGLEAARGFGLFRDLLVSGDGNSVYLAGAWGILATFSRDSVTGSLVLLDVLDGPIEVAPGDFQRPFQVAWGLAESPGGEHLYLAAVTGGLSTFSRSPGSGALTLVQHLRLRGEEVSGASVVKVSPDGRFVFVQRGVRQTFLEGSALLVFTRNIETGELALSGGCCEGFEIEEELGNFGFPGLALAPDGRELVATFFAEGRLARFSVDPATGSLALEELFDGGVPEASPFLGATDITSPGEGGRMYVVSNEADTLVAVTGLGTSRPLEVVEVLADGFGESVSGLELPRDLAISESGDTLVSVALLSDTVGIQRRDRKGGALEQTQVFDVAGPERGVGPTELLLSPDGRSLFAYRRGTPGYFLFRKQSGSGDWVFVDEELSISLADAVISPDGRHIYAPTLPERGSDVGENLAIYSRNRGGGLELIEVLEGFDAGDGTLEDFHQISSMVASPDGRHLVLSRAAGLSVLLVFSRNPETGALRLVQRIDSDGVIPDGSYRPATKMAIDSQGRNLYSKSVTNGLVVFERQASSGSLSYVESFEPVLGDPETNYLRQIQDLVVDPSGEFVFAVEDSDSTLVVYERDRFSGRLSLVERHRNGERGVDGLLSPRALAISPSGRSVYVTTDVGGIVAFSKAPAPCSGSAETLCLRASRFEVSIRWRTSNGRTGFGTMVPGGTDDSGLVWFFDQDNWEVLAKILDGCAVNGHFWVFSAATTNVEYTLTVRDTLTGGFKEYFNPFGSPAAAITDTEAFSACSAGREELAGPPRRSLAGQGLSSKQERPADTSAAKRQTCLAGEPGLCLDEDRFRVTVDWRKRNGDRGVGQAVALQSDDSGLFWFFNERNWEMLVKVLDGCAVNGSFWVFSAATTNVEYTLTVTDTATGMEASYFNPLGTSAAAVTDTSALSVCP